MTWLALIVAAAASAGLTPIVIGLLSRGGVYDVPNPRSSHDRPVPRGGGIAVGPAMLLALLASWRGIDQPVLSLAFTASAFGVVGLVDDIRDLSAKSRLAAQVAIGTVGSVLLLSGLGWSPMTTLVVSGVVVVWLISFVNAFNFMDGINGISVAQSAVAGLAWFVLGWVVGEPFLALSGLAQAGAALGFAPYNVGRAKIFLGDVGSYFLGGWMAALAVIGIRAGLPPEAVLAPMAIYVVDTGTTLWWRIRAGESWSQPHRYHVYQRLTDQGWSHGSTAVFAACAIGICAYLGGLTVGTSLSGRLAADTGLVLALVAYLNRPKMARTLEVA